MHLPGLDRPFRLACASTLAALCATVSFGQAPFLSYDFEAGGLGDFFNPTGPQAISYCTAGVVPAGEATVNNGELLFTNDDGFGITVLLLHPDTVAASFPGASRDYIARVRVNLETINEISFFVRSRMKIDEGAGQIDALYERGYSVSLFASGAHDVAPDGALAMGEVTECHTFVDHPEWPYGLAEGWGILYPGFPINQGEWYNIEVIVQGNDDGGPVEVGAKVWPDGDDPPATYGIIVTDPDGLLHVPDTLAPEADCEISFGTSFDAGQQFGMTGRADDLSITQLQGCAEAPAKATRSLWDDTVLAEGQEVPVYKDGQEYQVAIALTDLRAAGTCGAPAKVIVNEKVPSGWTAKDPSSGGTVLNDGAFVRWDVDPSGGLPALSYTAVAGGTGVAYFQGQVQEADAGYVFRVGGESTAASVEPVSDFGSIQHWLILGPFTRQVGGAAPGDAQIVRDYLTDGTVTEKTIEPRAGEQIEPDYAAAAASTGLAPDLFGRNPDQIPTWVEWRDYDDADDRIDFEAVYGPADDVMCYAVTYLKVLEDVAVNFGVSSDDSVQVLLDGTEIDRVNLGRSALDRVYLDTPANHPSLGNVELTQGTHILMVKVFEGGGEHNFRVGFLDETGLEIPGGLPEIEISLVPAEEPVRLQFKRGDADADGIINITDGIFVLNFLFIGGPAPKCRESAEPNNDGILNITDGIYILNYLFLGGPAPVAPGPKTCGPDPDPVGDPKDLGCGEYTKC
jgi:hypothetical protein